MRTTNRIPLGLLALALALSLAACRQPEAPNPDASNPANTPVATDESASQKDDELMEKQADEGLRDVVTAEDEDEGEKSEDEQPEEMLGEQPLATGKKAQFKFGANMYQMVTYNDESTVPKTDEYLNSGYPIAAYELILFDDGGGILYCGRSTHGVVYTESELYIDGEKTTLGMLKGRLVVHWGEDTLVFDTNGSPSRPRAVNSSLIGRFQVISNQGEGLARLRLRENGVGAYRKTSTARATRVYWGTDETFGGDYVMIDGVLYQFSLTRQIDTDTYQPNAKVKRYDIVVHDTQRTHFTAVDTYVE